MQFIKLIDYCLSRITCCFTIQLVIDGCSESHWSRLATSPQNQGKPLVARSLNPPPQPSTTKATVPVCSSTRIHPPGGFQGHGGASGPAQWRPRCHHPLARAAAAHPTAATRPLCPLAGAATGAIKSGRNGRRTILILSFTAGGTSGASRT